MLHYVHSFSSFNYVCSLPYFLDLLSSWLVIFCSLGVVFTTSLEKMMNATFGRERGRKIRQKSPQKSHCLEFAVRLAFKFFFLVLFCHLSELCSAHFAVSVRMTGWRSINRQCFSCKLRVQGAGANTAVNIFLHRECGGDSIALSACFARFAIPEYSKEGYFLKATWCWK